MVCFLVYFMPMDLSCNVSFQMVFISFRMVLSFNGMNIPFRIFPNSFLSFIYRANAICDVSFLYPLLHFDRVWLVALSIRNVSKQSLVWVSPFSSPVWFKTFIVSGLLVVRFVFLSSFFFFFLLFVFVVHTLFNFSDFYLCKIWQRYGRKI